MGNGPGERYDQYNDIILGFRSQCTIKVTKKWWEYIILCWIHIFFHYQRLLITGVSAQFAINMVKLLFLVLGFDTAIDAATLGWQCVVTFILHNQRMQSGKALKRKIIARTLTLSSLFLLENILLVWLCMNSQFFGNKLRSKSKDNHKLNVASPPPPFLLWYTWLSIKLASYNIPRMCSIKACKL